MLHFHVLAWLEDGEPHSKIDWNWMILDLTDAMRQV